MIKKVLFILLTVVSCKKNINSDNNTNIQGKRNGVWIIKTPNGLNKVNYINELKDGEFIEFGINKKGDTLISKKGFFDKGKDLNRWYYFYGKETYFLEENKTSFNKKILYRDDSVKFEWKSKITNFKYKDSSKISSGYVMYNNNDLFLGENIRIGEWYFYKNNKVQKYIFKKPTFEIEAFKIEMEILKSLKPQLPHE